MTSGGSSIAVYSPLVNNPDDEPGIQEGHGTVPGALPPAYEVRTTSPLHQQLPPLQPYPYQGGPIVFTTPHAAAAAIHRTNHLPRELQPNDYLVISVVVAIVCGIFNVSSLFLSVPALICSVMAFERCKNGEYKNAKQLGTVAIVFNLLTVTWVVVGGVIAVGMIVWWNTMLWYD